jgi:hypothetical protein
VTTYKSIRNLSACVEKRGRVGMGVWLQFGREELGWGRRRRNRGREYRQSGYILAMGVWLQFGRGELGWGRRRRNRGREYRQSGYILATIDGITNETFPSVYSSVSLPRHCMEILV